MRRALISVSDKTGLIELARFLVDQEFEILSTGGTAQELRRNNIPVTLISDYTDSPEILGGRVKTLHPKIFGGILYDRDRQDHQKDRDEQGISDIDVVIVNLYPFETTVAREGTTLAEAIEKIDVGGPSLLRAAAKNYRHVLPLCDPSLYEEFMSEMKKGDVSEEFRRRAAVRTFELTSRYDTAIANYLGGESASRDRQDVGSQLTLDLRRAQELRYGENPHQNAAFYLERDRPLRFEQLHGKELSYNNLLDLDAALQLAASFSEPACAVIKHTNPAGAACGATIAQAVEKAIAADPVSAFGGIVGVNGELDADSVAALGSLFLEVIVAPSFSPQALESLQKKKNLRLIRGVAPAREFEVRSVAGGYLIQSPDRVSLENWKTASRRQPSDEEMAGLRFAWIVAAHVKSNAIVIARGTQTVGVGAGQMSRVDSARLAIMKAAQALQGTVAASDAFFPFRDGLDILADQGITAVVQPGGSVRDQEVIAAADERGLAMVFTGERHFRH